MAKVTDRTVSYEILIRFGEDGMPQGAHYVTRRIVELGGERLKDEIGPAQPLALAADGSDRPVLNDVLGEVMAGALATIDVLNAERQVIEVRLRDAEARIVTVEAEKLRLAEAAAMADIEAVAVAPKQRARTKA